MNLLPALGSPEPARRRKARLRPSMTSNEPPQDFFATTRWSVVLRAGRSDTVGRAKRPRGVCGTIGIRFMPMPGGGDAAPRCGGCDAGLFCEDPAVNSLSGVEREKGRFRAFLLASMKHYLATNGTAPRRKSGPSATISLDVQAAEERYRCEPADAMTPEHLFERRWALTLLGHGGGRLCAEYGSLGRAALFTRCDSPSPATERRALYGARGQAGNERGGRAGGCASVAPALPADAARRDRPYRGRRVGDCDELNSLRRILSA